MSWFSWFLKFCRPASLIRKLCSSTIPIPCRIVYPLKDRLLCVSVRAADSYGTRDDSPSSNDHTFHLIFPSTFVMYLYGRIRLVNGDCVASVMSPSTRSVRYWFGPLRMSGRCHRPCRLNCCRSVLMSRADGPKMFSYAPSVGSSDCAVYVPPPMCPGSALGMYAGVLSTCPD